MINNSSCILTAELGAELSGYTLVGVNSKKYYTMNHILSNIKQYGYNFLDDTKQKIIDDDYFLYGIIKKSRELNSLNIYLEKNNYIAIVNFQKAQFALTITIKSFNEVASRKMLTNNGLKESVDLDFYVKILIDLSSGYMIHHLDAKII